MFQSTHAFSGFSVNDIEAAKSFYRDTLGLELHNEQEMGGGMFGLQFDDGANVMVYQKDTHEPATYTVLNFPVDDIDAAVDELVSKGIQFERYDGFEQDEKGIARSDSPEHGPDIAWFKDPAGNILAVLH